MCEKYNNWKANADMQPKRKTEGARRVVEDER